MKDSYYFPHDYHARNDPKLEELFLKLGCEGRGIYWTLIEMLYENKGYLLLEGKIDYYANALRTDSERITTVLNEYGLFKNDGKVFWSESCLERLKRLEEKREKARQSSFKRWGKDAKAMPSECEGIPIKESKVKESKVNNKEPKTKFLDFVLLTDFEFKQLCSDFGEAGANERIKNLDLYIGSKGDKYKSHYKTILMWEHKNKKESTTQGGSACKVLN
jgi:hypothetical protein